MELKEVTLEATTGGYRTEFFAAVAKQPAGKYYRYEENVPETTVRSAAVTEGRRLNKRFSVRTVKTAAGPYFAVGRSAEEKRKRSPKAKMTRETQEAGDNSSAESVNQNN